MRSAVHHHLTDINSRKNGRLLERRHGQQQRRRLHEREAPLPRQHLPIFFAESVYSEIGFARTPQSISRKHHELEPHFRRDTYDANPKIMEYYDDLREFIRDWRLPRCLAWRAKTGVTTLLAGEEATNSSPATNVTRPTNASRSIGTFQLFSAKV